MPPVDVTQLRAEMEAEREWREAELRFLKNRLAFLDDEEQRTVFRKALVVMLYAHFEGLCKVLLSMYVCAVNSAGILVGDAAAAVAAAALSDVFRALRDPARKCGLFRRTLPDDSKLHRFARDREFMEEIATVEARVVEIDPDDLVDTGSNVTPVVLRKILFRLGLDPAVAEPWAATVQQLVRRRNDVAHGSARRGIKDAEYGKLEQAVRLVVDDLVVTICSAVAREAYRAAAQAPNRERASGRAIRAGRGS